MAERRLKRPRDPIQLAKLIGDIATGRVEDRTEGVPARAKGGRPGGKLGPRHSARKSGQRSRGRQPPHAGRKAKPHHLRPYPAPEAPPHVSPRSPPKNPEGSLVADRPGIACSYAQHRRAPDK